MIKLQILLHVTKKMNKYICIDLYTQIDCVVVVGFNHQLMYEPPMLTFRGHTCVCSKKAKI